MQGYARVSEKSHAATRYGGDGGDRACYVEIGGVRYDTAASEELEHSLGFCDEMMVSVYRAKSGQWFLTEEENGSCGARDDDIAIRLITPEEASGILADFPCGR
jgi:hypothetical protein